MGKRHEVSDEEWALLDSVIPKSKAKTGRPARDRREMLNGLFWILCTGAQWRDLPERFGPWGTVYHHFNEWRKAGVYDAILDVLHVRLDQAVINFACQGGAFGASGCGSYTCCSFGCAWRRSPCAIIVVIRNRMIFRRFGQDRESSDVTASATRDVHGPAGNVGPVGLAPLRACLSTCRGLSDAESRVDFVQAAARE